jgi:serine protease Do
MKALEGSGADMSEANVAAIWTRGHRDELDGVPASSSHRPGWIGIKFQSVDLENMEIIAGTASGRENRGAIVAAVIDGSPAANAGLQHGDIILRLGGKKITAVRSLPQIVRSTAIGKTVPIGVWRDDRRITLQAQIGPFVTE